MGFVSITKTRKPRQFEYKPRFYDARRERLRAIEANAKSEMGIADGDCTVSRRARLELGFEASRGKRSRLNTRQTTRTLLIFALLILAAFIYIRL